MNDILGIIFLQLSLKDILNGRTINRQYKHAIDKLWYSLCKRDFYNALENINENTHFETYKMIYNLKKIVKTLNLIEPINLKILKNVVRLMSKNNAIKEFPKKIPTLKNLVALDLSCNYINSIPTNVLEELILLEEFSLANNELIKIPKEICKLSRLKMLDLSGNHIKKLKIWRLTTLEDLDLSSNHLKNISKLRNLIKLERFRASVNLIKEIPDIKNLKELIHLDISTNFIKEIPVYLNDLPKLETVYLTNNYIVSAPNFHFRLFIHPHRHYYG